ncbi:MAG: DNA polymerase III subunit gamma/tau [Candidatus Acidiferrales bacterium]
MSYQVIARKWRPQTFADVVGQRHVTQTLENAIRTGRVAHAYIFSGVRGVGKTTTARILAKALNCEKTQGKSSEPCNECSSCLEISAGNSLDVLEIDAASNRGIDQIRELREMVRYAPASSRNKVVILDEAHQLTGEASNALLKTLEEPPDRVIFILATTQSEDLLATIKSRAQLFQFRSLTFDEISGALNEIVRKEENLKIEPGAVAVLARAAEGSVRDALSLLEQAIAYCGQEITDPQVRELFGVVSESVLDDLVQAITEQSTERALELVQRLISEGQNLSHFCREAIRHFRNLLVARISGADSNLIAAPIDERPRLAAQAAQFSEEDLTRFFQILLWTSEDLRHKPDQRLHLEIGLLKLVNAARLAPLEELLAELRGEPGSNPGNPRPSAATASRASSSSAATQSSATHKGAPSISASLPPLSQSQVSVTASPSGNSASRSDGAGSTSLSTSTLISSRSTSAPIPAAPPRIVAQAAEQSLSGLAAAQVDAIKAALQGQQKFLWSLVEHVCRWELDGSEMRLFFPQENRALAEMLQARDPMEKLRTVLTQVVGQPLRVCVKLETGRATMGRGSELRARFEEDPVVQAMLKRFGGRLSEVKRRSEE